MRLSTAKSYIYAGMALLVAALLLSLASLYPSEWRVSVERSLGPGGHLAVASLIPGGYAGASQLRWAMVSLSTNCSSGARVLLYPGGGGKASYVALLPGHAVEVNMTSAGAGGVVGAGEGCRVSLRALLVGRSYPYQWLSLPALALMLGGTAALTLGAVLRLAGLEEA